MTQHCARQSVILCSSLRAALVVLVLVVGAGLARAEPTDLEKGLMGLRRVVFFHRAMCSVMGQPWHSLHYGVSVNNKADLEAFGADSILEQVVTILGRRLENLGEVSVHPLWKTGVVVLSFSTGDPDLMPRVKALAERSGALEFRMVDSEADYFSETAAHLAAFKAGLTEGGEIDMHESAGVRTVRSSDHKLLQAYLAFLQAEGQVPDDHVLSWQQVQEWQGGAAAAVRYEAFYLHAKVWVSGAHVIQAQIEFDRLNNPIISLKFNQAGTEQFAAVSGANVNKQLAIMLDGIVQSAPVIKEAITGGRAQITLGSGSPAEKMLEARTLVSTLRSGSIPAKLTLLSEQITPSMSPENRFLRRLLCQPPLPIPWIPGLLKQIRGLKE